MRACVPVWLEFRVGTDGLCMPAESCVVVASWTRVSVGQRSGGWGKARLLSPGESCPVLVNSHASAEVRYGVSTCLSWLRERSWASAGRCMFCPFVPRAVRVRQHARHRGVPYRCMVLPVRACGRLSACACLRSIDGRRSVDCQRACVCGRLSACLCGARSRSVSHPCVCRSAWACVVSLLVDLSCVP